VGQSGLGAPAWAEPPTSPEAALGTALTVDVGGRIVYAGRGQPRDQLTPQEEQIARLARDGLSNSEIGVRLFLSPRTVEWHPHKVFAKVGINSRRGLREALPGGEAGA
jgi:DNA-binding CsgD family transcriptional regulator